MVMALGAGKPLTEKDLSQIIHEIVRILQFLVPDRRRAYDLVAVGRQDFTGELVVWLVLGDTVANPFMEGESAGSARVVAAPLDAEHIGPLVREIVGVLW